MSSARRLLRRPGTRIALGLLAAITTLSLLAPVLPLPHPSERHPRAAARGPHPAWQTAATASLSELAQDHPLAARARVALSGSSELVGTLGTDALGRDLLSRILWGARVSLLVGLAATLVSVLIGVTVGVVAGSCGGRVDQLLMRTVDVLYAVPLLFIVILLVAVLRDDSLAASLRALGIDRLAVLFVVIGATSWLTMARVVRGQVLVLRSQPFVDAARALGAGPGRVVRRHLLPNLWGLVSVYLTLTVPRVMLTEAYLSFLGLGVEAPDVSWGLLASEGLANLTAVSTAWWLVVFPGLALALTLGALNALGDALRDALDPRLPA